jgi:predicted ATPase/transcriptional regulator with XRE-family HTH domain
MATKNRQNNRQHATALTYPVVEEGRREVNESQETFAALFRRMRKAAGLSQEELAERAGVSVRSVTNIEGGALHLPRQETLHLLAAALELTTGQEADLRAAVRAQRRSRAQRLTDGLPASAKRHSARVTSSAQHAAPLPKPLTPLIGREQELTQILTVVRQPEIRLVTLSGLGGVGKTRLALAAGAALVPHFTDGVTLISLASVRDPALALGTIAEAVGAYESPTRSLAAALRAILAPQHRLLLLDNLEHLVTAAPALTELLEDCPRLTLLVTSRVPLRVRGEHVVDVDPLPTPAPPPAPRRALMRRKAAPAGTRASERAPLPDDAYWQTARATPAVALFLACARATGGAAVDETLTLPQIAAIARQLDGLPLAIELAAATTRTLVPAELVAHVSDLLDLLSGALRDLPERQQSLRAALAWSYDLLPARSQLLFRRLAVCVGGCSLELVQTLVATDRARRDPAGAAVDSADDAPGAVVDARSVWDTLDPVLAHHLAWRETSAAVAPLEDTSAHAAAADSGAGGAERVSPAARIQALETIRAFAFEKLRAAGEEQAVRAAHARYFLAFTEHAATDLKGAQQGAALARLDQDRANLYAALDWCIESGDASAGLRLAGALGLYWEVRSLISEGRVWFERILALADAHSASRGAEGEAIAADSARWRSLRARAVNGAGSLAMWQGDYAAATARLEEALAIRRDLGDERAIAASVNNLGGLALLKGDFRHSRALWEETLLLRERLGEPRGVALAQLNCGVIAHRQGRSRQARTWLVTAEAAFQTLGDGAMRALALAGLGEALRQLGDGAGAAAALHEGLAVGRRTGRINAVMLATSRLAELARLAGQFDEGLERCEEALILADEHEEVREVVQILLVEGGLWLDCGEVDRATECVEQSQAISDEIRYQLGWAEIALWRGRLAIERQDWTEAREHLATSLALRHTIGTLAGTPDCLEGVACALVETGSATECETLATELASHLYAVAELARDGAPALRSPREQRLHRQLQAYLADHAHPPMDGSLALERAERMLPLETISALRAAQSDISALLIES